MLRTPAPLIGALAIIEKAVQFLRKDACSTWLHVQGLVESPYGQDELPDGMTYTRAIPPKPIGTARTAFARISALNNKHPTLVVIWDWSSTTEQPLPEPLQHLSDEIQPTTFDGSGIEFAPEESGSALDCVMYILSAQMTAYLYLPQPDASVLIWEGEFIEIWTRDRRTATAARSVLSDCGLKISIAYDG